MGMENKIVMISTPCGMSNIFMKMMLESDKSAGIQSRFLSNEMTDKQFFARFNKPEYKSYSTHVTEEENRLKNEAIIRNAHKNAITWLEVENV